jgi:hypothetical protein
VVLAGGLVLRLPVAIPVAVAVLGAEYAALVSLEADALDARAPLVAAALLAVAELAYWSLELRGGVADEPGTYLRRISVVAALAAAALGLGAGLLALVEVAAAGGIAADLIGAGAAILALALLAAAARTPADG